MQKIVAIVGSNHSSSDSKFILEKVSKTINMNEQQWDIKIVALCEYRILECRGCKQCFIDGECCLNDKDDMGILIQEIKTADIVIWTTPVYLANTSSTLKKVFDRLAHYTHVMRFAGIKSYVLITTDSSGGTYVSEYLVRVLAQFGFKVLQSYICIAREYQKIADQICNSIVKIKKLDYGFSNVRLEEIFRQNREYYSSITEFADDEKYFEIVFWNQGWVRQCSSFQEFAQHMINFRKHSKKMETYRIF